jgi:hypothetical protein
MALRWITDGAPQPKRIAIVYPDNAPFSVLAETSARIAAMLYGSDIRWTAITSGRESDVPNGVTVRLVSQRDVAAFEQGGGPVMGIEEVPSEEGEIAQRLFGARSAVTQAPVQGGGWRELYKGSRGSPSGPPPATPSDAGHGGPGMPHAGPPSTTGRYGGAGSEDRGAERLAVARMDDEPTRPWTSLSAGADGAGAEPPRAFSESARFQPGEIRASLGAPEYSPPPHVAAVPQPQPQPPVAAAPPQPPPQPQPQPQLSPQPLPPPVAAAQPLPPPQPRPASHPALPALPPLPPKAAEPSSSKPRKEQDAWAAGALSAEASPPLITDPLKAPAAIRDAAQGKVAQPDTVSPDADFRPASTSKKGVVLGLLVGVGALAAVAYFGFMSGPPPQPGDVVNPGTTSSPPPPSTQVTPADPAPTAPSGRTGTPAAPAPLAPSDTSGRSTAPTSTGKRTPPAPVSTRILNDEPTAPEPKPKPTKPAPTTTSTPKTTPTTSVFSDKKLFD